ncbi:unnamed protein product [Medioppia subpectinata]|uniref:Uncharacterized protein n=1 Tax=Medioppia subpectinata TaxID=1979941 RepID=A0A7R9KPZ8_9ACAR|nr:unnamed protein product [Medioppia subpectinata]CAG2107368.1 unnamed protein product [Medioppia subpectinata]
MNCCLIVSFVALIVYDLMLSVSEGKCVDNTRHLSYPQSMGYKCADDYGDHYSGHNSPEADQNCLKIRWSMDTMGWTGGPLTAHKCCYEWEASCMEESELNMNCEKTSTDDKFNARNERLKKKCLESGFIISQTNCVSLNPTNLTDPICQSVQYIPCLSGAYGDGTHIVAHIVMHNSAQSDHQYSRYVSAIISSAALLLVLNIF